ncbi:MAG TPA: ABC transporter transmembrane domain-containing protein, partial [Paracoccaceae bacterium]|nr:ABC transporter transmembrane domain-containing protein [Paracoccaceae bacterium]
MPPRSREPNLSTRAAYGRLWRSWVGRHWAMLALSALFMLLFAATSALLVRATVWIVDAFEARDAGTIAYAPAIVLAVTLLRAFSLYGQRVLNNRTLAAVEADLQRTMYGALLAADLARMQDEPPAALGARFTADIGLVRLVMDRLSTGLTYAATILGAFTQMLAIDWVLTAGVIAIFLAAMVPISHIGTRLKRISRRTQEQIGSMTA